MPPTLDPITAKDIDQPMTDRFGVVYTIAPSPLQAATVWVGTDDMPPGQWPGLADDACREIGVEQEVLSERPARRHPVPRDDLAQRRMQRRAEGHAPPVRISMAE